MRRRLPGADGVHGFEDDGDHGVGHDADEACHEEDDEGLHHGDGGFEFFAEVAGAAVG